MPQQPKNITISSDTNIEDILNRLHQLEKYNTELTTQVIVLQNIVNWDRGFPIAIVPFLDGTDPTVSLPAIQGSKDIDELTRNDFNLYLQGYGLESMGTDIESKRRLASFLGMKRRHDAIFPYHDFKE